MSLLFVGLGNPGAEYARNRHNIGFMAIDSIAEAHGAGPFRARFSGLCAESRIAGAKVLLLKPQTFMNVSGRAVGEMMRYHRLEPSDLVVFHDELDLAPFKTRIKKGGGDAGHNGLRSISAACGNAYIRIRIGIGHPGDRARVEAYVLQDFPKRDQPILDRLLDAIAQNAGLIVAQNWSSAQNALALAVRNPHEGDGRASGTRPRDVARDEGEG
jgi:PTH1 family peptidyl-tRNA hydrolase